jgi:hypothetical protein
MIKIIKITDIRSKSYLLRLKKSFSDPEGSSILPKAKGFFSGPA